MTIADALRDAAQRLAAISDTPRLDAELLMADALGTDRGALLLIDTRYSLPDYRALLPAHWAVQRVRNSGELSEKLSSFWNEN